MKKSSSKITAKFDIFTSDDIKIYYIGKFQNFTAGYIINPIFHKKSLSTLNTEKLYIAQKS